MSEKIHFPCPYCSTQLAVSSEYAGQQAKCPGCGAVVSVPVATEESDSDESGAPEELQHTAPYFAPLSRNVTDQANMTKSVPSELPSNDYAEQRPSLSNNATATRPSFGRSFLGLVAATFVGGVCAVAWLAVVIFFQVEIGILAWGIGALIGLVAGSIAKNPSAIYCSLVACVAGFSILASKFVMVAFLMIASLGVNLVEDLQNLIVSNKFEHAYVDQQLADNSYQAEKIKLAETFNKDYFEDSDASSLVVNGREIGGLNGDPETMGRPMSEFRKEVRMAMANATKEQKEIWIDNARKRHPDWIVDPSYATAAKILFLKEPGKLDEDLAKQATHEVRIADYLLHSSDSSDTYLADTPSEVLDLRSDTLKTLVRAKLKDLDSQGMKNLAKEAATKDPSFVPDETAFIVIADELLAKEELPAELRSHASSRVQSVTQSDFSSDFFVNLGTDEFIEKELKLREIVNPLWIASTNEEIDQKIADSKIRHAGWDPDSTNPEWIASDELKEEIGDGSFMGSVQKVFAASDLLWLFLGFVSAFGTARSRADRTA
jgi:hypothetical protein